MRGSFVRGERVAEPMIVLSYCKRRLRSKVETRPQERLTRDRLAKDGAHHALIVVLSVAAADRGTADRANRRECLAAQLPTSPFSGRTFIGAPSRPRRAAVLS